MWIYCNPNPARADEDDCVIRAICIATGMRWEQVHGALCRESLERYAMPSTNHVWGAYLYRLGFRPFLLPESCPLCVTVRAFCRMYPRGTYIIGTGNHAVTVIDGNYYDTWDSGDTVPTYFWRIE